MTTAAKKGYRPCSNIPGPHLRSRGRRMFQKLLQQSQHALWLWPICDTHNMHGTGQAHYLSLVYRRVPEKDWVSRGRTWAWFLGWMSPSFHHRDWLWERHVVHLRPIRVGPRHFSVITCRKRWRGRQGKLGLLFHPKGKFLKRNTWVATRIAGSLSHYDFPLPV